MPTLNVKVVQEQMKAVVLDNLRFLYYSMQYNQDLKRFAHIISAFIPADTQSFHDNLPHRTS